MRLKLIESIFVFLLVIIPFGGPIVKIIPPIPPICPFPVLIIGPPVPMAVALTPGTLIIGFRSIRPGVFTLGWTGVIGTGCPYAGIGIYIGTGL